MSLEKLPQVVQRKGWVVWTMSKVLQLFSKRPSLILHILHPFLSSFKDCGWQLRAQWNQLKPYPIPMWGWNANNFHVVMAISSWTIRKIAGKLHLQQTYLLGWFQFDLIRVVSCAFGPMHFKLLVVWECKENGLKRKWINCFEYQPTDTVQPTKQQTDQGIETPG